MIAIREHGIKAIKLNINDIPDHVKQNISTGEEIISTFMGNVKFGKKSYSKVLCILTTEKFMADTKKALEKLFLTNIISTERKKAKITLHGMLRSGDELKVIIEVLKNPGEKKDAFNSRLEEFEKNFDVFSQSATEEPKEVALNNDNKPTPQSGTESTPVRRFCPNCGSKLPEGGKFCANCGTKVM
ncbi:MAG: zinc-ribbon domain-containing protein [Candidatus Helarchaeota archaeon]